LKVNRKTGKCDVKVAFSEPRPLLFVTILVPKDEIPKASLYPFEFRYWIVRFFDLQWRFPSQQGRKAPCQEVGMGYLRGCSRGIWFMGDGSSLMGERLLR
jgi:hypothetical protein